MRRTLLFAAVCMLMAGTQSSAQGSSGERLGAGVAEILDEEADVPDLQNADTDATEKDGERISLWPKPCRQAPWEKR